MLIPSYSDAYWIGEPVGCPAGTIYGSARGGLVKSPETDEAYQAWIAEGFRPWPWPNDETGVATTAALDFGLTTNGLPPTGLTPMSKADLIAYANGKVTGLLAVPKSYGPLGSGGPTVKCDGTTATGVSLAAINAWGAAAPTATQPWLDDFGVATTITGAQGVLLAAAAGAYAFSVWAIAAAACTAILAGTITTLAQIDAEAWPT